MIDEKKLAELRETWEASYKGFYQPSFLLQNYPDVLDTLSLALAVVEAAKNIDRYAENNCDESDVILELRESLAPFRPEAGIGCLSCAKEGIRPVPVAYWMPDEGLYRCACGWTKRGGEG